MRVLPFIVALSATASYGQSLEYDRPDGDILVMRQGNPWAEVYYYNSDSHSSSPVVGQKLEINGVEVRVWINLNAGPLRSEKITVIPEDSQMIAIPAEAFVKDGEDITIVIMPPMF